jgi:16S rRNA processing protein RimM
LKSDVESFVAIGRIVKPFGVGGEVVVQKLTDTAARFRRLTSVFVGATPASAIPLGVTRAVIGDRGIRMKFETVNDRDAAERVVGDLLFVAEKDAVKLPRGRYFVHDVVGMQVMDEIRGAVGTVREVLRYPAQDVYVIEWNGRSYMIPAVKEFVRHFDVPGKVLHVRLIEGLVEKGEGEEA